MNEIKGGLRASAKSITSCCKEATKYMCILVHFVKKYLISLSVFVALTSETNGKTEGRGNRATVVFIKISLRVCKTFCRKKTKTLLNSHDHSIRQTLIHQFHFYSS